MFWQRQRTRNHRKQNATQNNDRPATGAHRKPTFEEIGLVIERMREDAFLTRRQFALSAGVDESTVERIENGGAIDTESLKAISAALGLRPDVFLTVEVPIGTQEDRIEAFRAAMQDTIPMPAQDFADMPDVDALLSTEEYIILPVMRGEIPPEFQTFNAEVVKASANYFRQTYRVKEQACRTVLESFQTLARKGYIGKYAAYTSEDSPPVKVAQLLVGSQDDEGFTRLAYLAVPRLWQRLRNAAWNQ